MKPNLLTIAKILLINDKTQVLVMTVGTHRTKPERSFTPDLPGGQIDPGETIDAGIIREIEEETGVDLGQNIINLVYADTRHENQTNESITELLYIARLHYTPQVHLSWEHSDYRWVPISELKTTNFRLSHRKSIDYCFSIGLL